MTKFTPEELVQYLYNETSMQKTTAIENALETDWDLQESLEFLQTAQKNLEEINLSPRTEAVNRILQHSTKKVGQLHSH